MVYCSMELWIIAVVILAILVGVAFWTGAVKKLFAKLFAPKPKLVKG